MPTVSRVRTVHAAPEAVWLVVSDPERLPRWWPGVRRVEQATPEAWTTVLVSPSGQAVRADCSRLAADEPRLIAWRHELGESPLGGVLSDAVTELRLEPQAGGTTRVRLTLRSRPRGLARLGRFQLSSAMRRQLEDALDGLAAIV